MGPNDHISNHPYPDHFLPHRLIPVKIWHQSHHAVHSHMHLKLSSWVLMTHTLNHCFLDSVWSLAATPINLYQDRRSLLFHIEIGIYIILISNDQLVTQWKLCFKLDNQCLYTLLAQIYHVYLIFQMEIIRCLMIIIMRFKTVNIIIPYLFKFTMSAYYCYFR